MCFKLKYPLHWQEWMYGIWFTMFHAMAEPVISCYYRGFTTRQTWQSTCDITFRGTISLHILFVCTFWFRFTSQRHQCQQMWRTWRRHQMETFSALLAICSGNSLVTGEFLAQRPVTRSFDVFFNLRQTKPLSKQWWGWWFETPSCPLWRQRNEIVH